MNQRAALVSNRIARATPILVITVFAFVCAAGLWRVVATLGLRVPFDPNEGWNAYHAAAAMAGRPLYPDARAFFVNNYPPLSFYLVGLLGRVVGDNIVAGRIVSLLSFFAVAAGIFQAARLMGCRVRNAGIAGLLFMAWLVVSTDYVGMNDPQLLGHAIGIAGLLLVLRSPPKDIMSAVLFAAALFVKHNLVAMPAAIAIWLLLQDRARARRFIGAGMVTFLSGLALFRFVTGSDLLSHLASARAYSFALLTANVGPWLVWSVIPIVMVSVLLHHRRHDKHVVVCALYAGAAIVLGIGFSGGAGVDTNAFFDADIALSLGVGVALDRFGRDHAWRAAFLSAALFVPLAFGLAQASSGEDWRDADFWIRPMADEAATARRDILFIAARPDRALCETLSYCYWAGKMPEVDVFNTGQQFATGERRDDELARLIEAHAFSSLQFDTLEPFALGPHVKAAVLKAYRIDHTDDGGVFFVPR